MISAERHNTTADNLTILAESAKAFAVLIETATTSDALEAVASEHVKLMDELMAKLPSWHKRLLDIIATHRKGFEQVEVVA